ncbi:hypothetical protein [uncultured Fusobacterium sp.]|uniref:hypothetical protein n=1 Tax=uncultured Fusobacterium sp. TaxID=159267 RepID=UPI0025FFB51A|nr:hypothetical protein [uncultured Fusobacterium sp.]
MGRPLGYKPTIENPKKKNKTALKFGYKYTHEEAMLIDEVLEMAKAEYKTTSKSILEIFKFYKENRKR